MKPILILAILLATASCSSPQILTERIVTDTTIIREIPRIIQVPGASIQSPSINLDSLVQLIQSGISHETISQTLIREDPETKLRVGIMLDALGNLTAVCEQQERTIEILEKQIERLRTEKITNTVIEKPGFWKSLFQSMQFPIIIILLAIIIISIGVRGKA